MVSHFKKYDSTEIMLGVNPLWRLVLHHHAAEKLYPAQVTNSSEYIISVV